MNGHVSRATLAQSGYLQGMLADVDALRFQYLTGLGAKKSPYPSRHETTNWLLLVVGFTREQTLAVARCLLNMLHFIHERVEITYRAHSACDVDVDELGGVAGSVSRRSLLEILQQYDWAFSSNPSSAGLDILLSGLRVAVFSTTKVSISARCGLMTGVFCE